MNRDRVTSENAQVGRDDKNRQEWHTLTGEALGRNLRSDLEHGLTWREAEDRLAVVGLNELPEVPPPSPLSILIRQFTSLIVWVLLGAALISGFLQEWIDAAAILTIVFLNALLGFVQEYRAERSLAALRKLSMTNARIVRDSMIHSIPARNLVPGDVIHIEAGDRIPADSRLFYATTFQTQEASLTGESIPVPKSADPIPQIAVPLADRHNMLFMGTVAVSGKGQALVTATGSATEIGKIAALVQSESQAEREETPLQRRLEQLGWTLLRLSLVSILVVFLLGTMRGEPLLLMFLTAVSLAVAAIPEGLPAIVTITLALGVTRMVERHALIRRLPTVETLGSTTVICSDKTGTLTKNQMTVTRLFIGGDVFEVTGEGYVPVGEIRAANHHLSHGYHDGSPPPSLLPIPSSVLHELLMAGLICNGASLKQDHGIWQVVGDPTEGALLVAAAKVGLVQGNLQHEHTVLGEVPFDSERKQMTVVSRTPSGLKAFVKGAPDVLLRNCTSWMSRQGVVRPLTEETRAHILAVNQQFASEALRVLGVAIRHLDRPPDLYTAVSLEHGLTFVGLFGMKDPIRSEAKASVAACRMAGIRTVMITGDHKDTAVAIGRELGILDSGTEALSGAELDHIADEELILRVAKIAIYSRASAEHKLRVIRAWKRQGAVVAMTGDGVNDAPALKAADIGIAMGITGTDVTKEVSDMVITDDNFASIAAAVEEGRGIYENIRKSTYYLLSCNISEILLMLTATLLGFPLPLVPIQILWINLVTDGLPALALAMEPKEPDVMRYPPRSPTEPFLPKDRLLLLCGQGLFLALIALATFIYALYELKLGLDKSRGLTFTVLVLAQLFHAFNNRSERLSLLRIGILSNKALLGAFCISVGLQIAILTWPPIQEIFGVASLDAALWVFAFAVGISPLVVMELWKWFKTLRMNPNAQRSAFPL
jgi:P-type Ca2+ transporter type 2C